MRNTGKPSEEEFEAAFARYGKAAHVNRLVDAAEIKGRTGRIGLARKQDADYVVTHQGKTFYAEVKSTIDPDKYVPKIRQKAKAIIITTAGGDYDIFVHSLAHDCWYRIPFTKLPTGSTPWSELKPFLWRP